MSQKITKYKFAVIATDVIIFTVRNEKLHVLLIKMKKKPFTGMWAAPGGLVRPSESVEASAKRNLKNKTGVSNVYLEQLYTFGDVNRDPFGRVVSVAYYALIPSTGVKLKTSKEYEDVAWFPADKLPSLAYDHKEIIEYAVTRLRWKLEYTNVVYSLLPHEFTLTEMQKTYETILNKELDKRNFRKKILALNIIRSTGKKNIGAANRPALLYSFKSKKPAIVELL